MSRQNANKNKKRSLAPGSGTEYHQKRASHVPDYGGNSMDPNSNMTEKQ